MQTEMDTQIETRYGRIRGVREDGYLKFLGIPYAKPPVGNLRFRRPQKPEKWNGILPCTDFAPIAMQEPMRGDGMYVKEFYSDPRYQYPCSEDCLYLNIWVPEDGGKHPVAMWIHGGGFHHGFSGEVEFDGAAYAKRDVILVTVAYRCNVFGFLAHSGLLEKDSEEAFGNYGLYDQIAALDWIYENIEAFGGDRDNITVFGQSAGAMSTQALISTELTGNRITKAILQSGGGYCCGYPIVDTREEAEKIGQEFVDFLHLKTIEELYDISAEELLEKYLEFKDRMFSKTGPIVFRPCIDGKLLKDSFDGCIEKGMIKKIPYMIGSTENDIGSDEKQESETYPRLYEGCRKFSFEVERQCGKSAYVYYFTHRLPGDEAGAFHSSELWYTFRTLDRCWRPFTEEDYRLSDQMLGYWTNFIKNGDPNGSGLPVWDPCRKERDVVKIFY